jgi:hypothetical protein
MFGRQSEHDVGDPQIIRWVQELPLSRTMGKTALDLSSEFDDGVCLAELFNYFKPGSVDLASFYNEFNRGKKNWLALHKKFLKGMKCGITSAEVELIIKKKPDCLPVIERILRQVKTHLEGGSADAEARPSSSKLKKTTSSSGGDRGGSKESSRLVRSSSKAGMKKEKGTAGGKKAAMRNKEKKKSDRDDGEPKRKVSVSDRLKAAVFGKTEKAEEYDDDVDLGATGRSERASSASSLSYTMSKDLKVCPKQHISLHFFSLISPM